MISCKTLLNKIVDKTFGTALILFLLYNSVAAQVLIKTGDERFHYDEIKPSHDFQRVTVFDSLGNTTLEFINESVIRIDSVNKLITFARFRQYPFGRHLTDTSVTTSLLVPVQMHEFDNPVKFDHSFKFDKLNVEGQIFKNESYFKQNYTMPEGYFDDNMIETVIGYFPFEKGIIYHLNCFRLESNGLNDYTIEYKFDDTWNSANNNQLNCAVLYFTNQYSSGYIWIDKNSHKNVKQIGRIKSFTYLIVAE